MIGWLVEDGASETTGLQAVALKPGLGPLYYQVRPN